MNDQRDEGKETNVSSGDINANDSKVASGSDIDQSSINSPTFSSTIINQNIIQNPQIIRSALPEAGRADATQELVGTSKISISARFYDGRPTALRLDIVKAISGSRCLLFNSEAMTLPMAILFSYALFDGVSGGYQAACWLNLPDKSTLITLTPLFSLIGVSVSELRQKNFLAQAIVIAKALRQHPTLLVLQGFDDQGAKSLSADFSALIEMALEDDIGRSSIVILSASQSLTSRWGAKLLATTSY